MALAGDDQNIAAPRARRWRRGWPRPGRRFRARRGQPARISLRIAAGSSLRGLSSVTITSSANAAAICAHQRALALVAVAAAAEHDMQLALRHAGAAPAALSPAHPACGRNRHRSARRTWRKRPSPSGPARRSDVRAPRKLWPASSPRPIASPAATSALEAWKLRPAAVRHVGADRRKVIERLGIADALRDGKPDGLALSPTVTIFRPARAGGGDETLGMVGIDIDHRNAAVARRPRRTGAAWRRDIPRSSHDNP